MWKYFHKYMKIISNVLDECKEKIKNQLSGLNAAGIVLLYCWKIKEKNKNCSKKRQKKIERNRNFEKPLYKYHCIGYNQNMKTVPWIIPKRTKKHTKYRKISWLTYIYHTISPSNTWKRYHTYWNIVTSEAYRVEWENIEDNG